MKPEVESPFNRIWIFLSEYAAGLFLLLAAVRRLSDLDYYISKIQIGGKRIAHNNGRENRKWLIWKEAEKNIAGAWSWWKYHWKNVYRRQGRLQFQQEVLPLDKRLRRIPWGDSRQGTEYRGKDGYRFTGRDWGPDRICIGIQKRKIPTTTWCRKYKADGCCTAWKT